MRDVTVIIPTSPIKSHPDTSIIDETLNSVWHHMPGAEVILTFDGLRSEQEHYKDAYNEYKTEMLWRCLHTYKNVLPIVFDDVQHQSGMMHAAMKEVRTPLILYMEHDAPLVTDLVIDWERCKDFIWAGEANTIRFHFENVIPTDHRDLMIGNHPLGFTKTIQWSQRPHLSTKVYYEEIMRFFPPDARSFIEDEWHGVVMNDYYREGMFGWYKHRLWIYTPKGGMKRSYTTDGRGSDLKFGEGFKKK